MLGETFKNVKHKTVGLKQTQRALEKGHVKRLYVAEDAEPHVLRSLLELCADHNVERIDVPTMEELGRACGIDVGTSAAAILAD